MKGSGKKFQGSLQWKVNGTFYGANWNFYKGYIGSFLSKLQGRFLEGNRKGFKYLTMKYFREDLRKLPISLHGRLPKMSTGRFHGKLLETKKKLLGRTEVKLHIKISGSF